MTYEQLKSLYAHEKAIGKDVAKGTVYTPRNISNQMVFYLLESRLKSNNQANAFPMEGVHFRSVFNDAYINQIPIDALLAAELLKYILPLKVLDLACGSGNLLLAYIEFVEYLFTCTGEMDSKMRSDIKQFIQECICGIDIDPEAIRALTELLDANLAEFQIYDCSYRFYVGNSLIESSPIDEMKFDLIIGNPPYIGEKNNLECFKPIKTSELGKLAYEGKMDYFYFFIYKAHLCLKEGGLLCYLSSHYFLTADGAVKLRHFLKNNFRFMSFVDYQNEAIFPEKKLHACAYVLQKNEPHNSTPHPMVAYYGPEFQCLQTFEQHDIYTEAGTIAFIEHENDQHVIARMNQNKGLTLGEVYSVNQGIVSGYDRAFVYSYLDAQTIPENLQSYLVPFYKNSDIDDYSIKKGNNRLLLYIHSNILTNPHALESLEDFLQSHRSHLETRREVQKNRRKWYMLTWPRDENIFMGEKIVSPQRATHNKFAYSNESFYASADVYYITKKDDSPYSLKLLTFILNAPLYFTWLKHIGKRKGPLFELYATPLKSIPLPNFTKYQIEKLEHLVDSLFTGTYDDQLISEIQNAVNDELNIAFDVHSI